MSIPTNRIIKPEQVRNFGHFGDAVEVPPLTDVQLRSYDRFLQLDVAVEKRQQMGLEGVLKEIFPIESYDKKLALEYMKYELGKPRYGPDECRQLRLTYGRPFRVWLRLNKEQPVEEEVYLGDMPIMIGGGKFSAMTLLRAMDPLYSTDADIIKAFYSTEDVKLTPATRAKVEGAQAVG